MGSCVSWLLLLSQAVVLGIAVTGVWVSVNNFGNMEEPPPTPPPNRPTITPEPYDYARSYYGGNRRNSESINYLQKTRNYALLLIEPQFILSVPCGAAGVTAFLTLTAGVCSRGIFTTTASLYSNLGQLILTLLGVFGYQVSESWRQSYDGYEYRPNVGFWMVSLQSGMVAVLLLQFVLNIWELRRQKSGWPTFHFTHFFTWEFLVMVARLTLVCNVVGMYLASSLVFGLQRESWKVPNVRYPLWLSVSAGVAAGFSAGAILENLLSLLFGILHPQIVWMSALLSSVGHAWIAVLASPVFKTAYLEIYNESSNFEFVLLITGIISSLCCFLHAVACWFGAKRLRTPPIVVLLAAESFKTFSLADLFMGTKSLISSMEVVQNGALALFKSAEEKSTLMKNVVASAMSIVGIIFLAIGMASSRHPPIGAMVLMMVDVCVFQRNVPNVIIYMYTKQVQGVKAPFAQRVVWHAVECVLVLGGAIATFTLGFILIVALVHFMIYAIKTMVLVQEHLDNTKGVPHQKLQEKSESEGEEADEGKCEKERESDLYIPV